MYKWNYVCPTTPFFGEQKDWNQTLITKFNQISAENKDKVWRDKDGLILVHVPIKAKHLIESFEYFKDGKIGSKYTVRFIESEKPIIEVGGFVLEIENL